MIKQILRVMQIPGDKVFFVIPLPKSPRSVFLSTCQIGTWHLKYKTINLWEQV